MLAPHTEVVANQKSFTKLNKDSKILLVLGNSHKVLEKQEPSVGRTFLNTSINTPISFRECCSNL